MFITVVKLRLDYIRIFGETVTSLEELRCRSFTQVSIESQVSPIEVFVHGHLTDFIVLRKKLYYS